MGLLDSLSPKPGGLGETGGVLTHLMEMVNNPQTGGLGGLVRSFQANGLGGVVASWVSTGTNQAIAPERLTQVIGAERVQNIAGALGVDPTALSSQLASMLPSLVDRLTPDGQLPDGTTPEQIAAGVPAGG